ncbi:MAG TPA: hypothetical protein PLM53_08030 [Spirochaetota bacterium]|nr:hypothetical protein [Spirochaetota bacterium]HPC42466.1 hypothetical protein [Spirochaetota bacterium]HPL15076.1 hypothetical protein [Spirochaetota bacterium]HQF08083.1 hypothetical protein [Spirochaetota bacterium]HQH97030.1 hypothetical protein [Spirochaetota bacterium]
MNYYKILLLTFVLFAAGYAEGLYASEFSRSVSYTRTQGRAAAVGSLDAVYYNPAGLAAVKDGLHIDVGYQVMTKTTSYAALRMNGEDKEPTPFVPNFAMAYKKGKGAVFISLCMPEGVEFLEFRKPKGGMPLVSNLGLNLDPVQTVVLRRLGLTIQAGGFELPLLSYTKASRYWLQGRLGGAFSIGDMFSFAGGIACNYYNADRSAGIAGAGTIDKIEREALGWSGFAGVMIGAPKTFVLTALYETQVIARGTEKNVKYNYSHMMEQRYPDSLLVGFNLKAGEGASLQFSYQVAFTGERRYGTRNILSSSHELGYLDWALVVLNRSDWSILPYISNGNIQNYKYKNRHTVGFTMEFEVSGVVPSMGISYATQEKYPRTQNPLDPDLARVGLGVGIKFPASNAVTLESGTAYYFYIKDRMFHNSVKMNKMAWTWGINASFRAM